MTSIEIIQGVLTAAFHASRIHLPSLQDHIPLLAVLALTSVIMPLVAHQQFQATAKGSRGIGRLLIPFLMNLGFFLVTIPAIEQITLFLGRQERSQWIAPSVLVLFIGMGNFSAYATTASKESKRNLPNRLALLASLLVLYLFAFPSLLSALSADASEYMRIVLSIALVAPLGALLGRTLPSMFNLPKPGPTRQWLGPLFAYSAISVPACITTLWLFSSHGFALTLFFGFATYVIALSLAVSQEAFS